MLEVKFYDTVDDSLLKFAVIISLSNGKWVFCKHKERDTYEAPGGHREVGEDVLETAKSGWFFSIRSISCLKRMYLRMSAMAPKTSGWSRGRSSGVQKRHWSWWVFRKNFSDSPRLSFPADKNGEWQLQVCLQWSRIFWCWMSRQQDLIRRAGTKY